MATLNLTPDADGVVRARDERPTHLVRQPGDKRSVCGIKDPLPVCAAKAALGHHRGRGAVFCSICVAGLGPLAPKVRTAQPQEAPQ